MRNVRRLATMGVIAFLGSFAGGAVVSTHATASTIQNCPPGRPCSSPTGISTGPITRRPAPAPRVPGINCPEGTVYDARSRRCVGTGQVPGRTTGPMRPAPARGTDRDEISATNLVNSAMRGLDCSQAGDALRRLSNQVLSLAASAQNGGGTGSRGDFKEQWRQHIRSPKFWMKVWDKMADAYRSCSRDCFDDGAAVGEISAIAYCSASIAVEGLPGIGFLAQPPLPVCETAIHVGCVQSYQRTATGFQGCTPYTTDQFSGIFAEYQSQDCHL